MSIAVQTARPSLGAAVRTEEVDADASLLAASRLSEAALRDAAALRHASTTPSAVALVCQGCETLVLALATWGATQSGATGAGPVGDALAALTTATLATTAGRLFGAYRMTALRRFFSGLMRIALGVGALAALTLTYSALSGEGLLLGVIGA